tara:strand:- start:2463 stop:3296 length:834 start_codon:yes stop_codon:yes gene_type:complete
MDFIKKIFDSIYSNVSAEWWLWAFIFITLIFPIIYSSIKGENNKNFKSKNFITDCIYSFFEMFHIWQFLIIVPLSVFLGKFLNENFSFITIGFISSFPIWVQLFVLFIVMDLSVYLVHRFQHSNIYAWQFHKTHHSQKFLTALTTFRKTILDRVFELLLLSLPAFILSIDYTFPLYIVMITTFHQLIIHTDTSFTFGIFGKIIVSPSFHELHHSIDEKHKYANFGGVLTIWDKLFGTYMSSNNKIKYGISDEKIPENFFSQLIVPIVGLLRLFKNRK